MCPFLSALRHSSPSDIDITNLLFLTCFELLKHTKYPSHDSSYSPRSQLHRLISCLAEIARTPFRKRCLGSANLENEHMQKVLYALVPLIYQVM